MLNRYLVTLFVKTFILLLVLYSCNGNKGVIETPSIISIAVQNEQYADYSLIIQKSVDTAKAGSTILLPVGTLNIKKTVNIDKPLIIKGKGKNKTIIKGLGRVFNVTGKLEQQFSLKNNLKKGQKKITVNNLKRNVPTGALICFESQELFEEKDVPYKKEHCNRVQSSTGNIITLEKEISFSFFEPNIFVKIFSAQNFRLSDLSLIGNNDLYINTFDYLTNIVVENVKFKTISTGSYGRGSVKHPKAGVSALGIYHSTNINITQCQFENIWYGVLTHKGCNSITISECRADNSHHLNNTALGTDNLLVENCETYYCEGGYDSHETAISSTFRNCKDYFPQLESKFRGRRDLIENSLFEKGIEMFYDSHLPKLIEQDEILFKKLKNSNIGASHSVFKGSNVQIFDSNFEGTIAIQNSEGSIIINNSNFLISNKKRNKQRPEALTIGGNELKGYDYDYEIIDCSLSCKDKASTPIGIYIPNQGGKRASLKNIEITGFEKGLVLYGGAKAAHRYDNFFLDNILFEACGYGIFHQSVNKNTDLRTVKFKNCKKQLNNPNSFVKRKKDQ